MNTDANMQFHPENARDWRDWLIEASSPGKLDDNIKNLLRLESVSRGLPMKYLAFCWAARSYQPYHNITEFIERSRDFFAGLLWCLSNARLLDDGLQLIWRTRGYSLLGAIGRVELLSHPPVRPLPPHYLLEVAHLEAQLLRAQQLREARRWRDQLLAANELVINVLEEGEPNNPGWPGEE